MSWASLAVLMEVKLGSIKKCNTFFAPQPRKRASMKIGCFFVFIDFKVLATVLPADIAKFAFPIKLNTDV